MNACVRGVADYSTVSSLLGALPLLSAGCGRCSSGGCSPHERAPRVPGIPAVCALEEAVADVPQVRVVGIAHVMWLCVCCVCACMQRNGGASGWVQ